jgi:hypothetical protein
MSPPVKQKRRRIRKWDDLSFVKRDADGKLLSWFMPSRENNWHEHYGIGETWFDEIAQLARVNPGRAHAAMRFAAREACAKYGSYGHTDGFFDMMARWALSSILVNKTLPELPCKITEMGIPVREGMDFWLAREGKPEDMGCATKSAYTTLTNDKALRAGIRLVAADGKLLSTRSDA